MDGASHPGRKRTKRDPVRLLHRHSPRAYTEDPNRALHHEPEAVSAEDQERIAYAVRRGERDAQLLRWRERREVIEKQIDWAYCQRFQVDVSKQLRFLRRQLDYIDKRISAA